MRAAVISQKTVDASVMLDSVVVPLNRPRGFYSRTQRIFFKSTKCREQLPQHGDLELRKATCRAEGSLLRQVERQKCARKHLKNLCRPRVKVMTTIIHNIASFARALWVGDRRDEAAVPLLCLLPTSRRPARDHEHENWRKAMTIF